MNNIAIYGAGGFGREVLLLLRQLQASDEQCQVVGFYDDGKTPGSKIDGVSVLGGLAALKQVKEPLDVVIAIADPAIRKQVVTRIENSYIQFPTVIHPDADTGSEGNQFGEGSIVTTGVICTVGISVGRFAIVNLQATLGHDVSVGDFSTIMPGCNISGAVNVGDECLIGSGAVVLQNLTIGHRSKVGAGAVVTQSVPEGITVVGVPARPTV